MSLSHVPITRTEWDRLAAGRFYSSSNWLELCSHDATIRADAVYDHLQDGTLAAVPVAEVCGEPNPFYRWTDELTARGLPSPPPEGLLIGPHRGYQTHLLTGPATDLQAARVLLPAIREYPLRDATAPRIAMFLCTSGSLALRSAGVRCIPVLLRLDAWFAVPSDGEEAWLSSLGTRRRAAIVRRELRQFGAAGYRVTEAPLSDWTDMVGQFVSNTEARYGHSADPSPRIAFLRQMARVMGERARVLLCSRPGEPPVGHCLFYRWGDTIFLRSVGFDYRRLLGAAEYFNMAYYVPLRMAAREGKRWVHAGIEATEAKALRGAQLRPLWLLDLSRDSPLDRDPANVIAANRRTAARLRSSSPVIAKAWPPGADPDAAEFGI